MSLFTQWLRRVLMLPVLAGTSTMYAAEPLRFGAMPFLPPERMVNEFGGYADWLTSETGSAVSFESFPDFDIFTEAIKTNTVDIVWVGPMDVSRALDAGFTTLVRTNRDFSAIIVTDKATITAIQDLENRAIGKTRPDASTTRLANRALVLEGLRGRVTTYHFDEHERCFEAMINDKVAACVTHEVPAALFERARNVKFRTIYETAAIPSSVIGIHESLPAETRRAIVDALTRMNTTEFGRQLLAESGISDGWVPATAAEYREISGSGTTASLPASSRREESPVIY